MNDDTAALRAELVRTLADNDAISDPRWLAAFRDVPRGVFVPQVLRQSDDRTGWVLLEAPSPEWCRFVYRDEPLITQLDGNDSLIDAARRGGPVTGVPTSSSSAPQLMALMLQALDVHDGHTVLEVGTGSGYNAALLSHRLGPAHVTSVDVDPALVSRARERLAELGYRPRLAARDGTRGHPETAPYDRVIITVGLPQVPATLIDQTQPGGLILLPLDRRNRGGLLARLTVAADGNAQGRFLPDYGGFMPTRTPRRADLADRAFRTIDTGQDPGRHTDLSAAVVTDQPGSFESFAALTLPGGGWDHLGFTPDNGDPPETWIAQHDGSWACHTTEPNGTYTVRQGGPTRLWDQFETAHRHWSQLGRPSRDRLGLTIHDTRHTVWLDHPDSPHHWGIPALPRK